MNSSICSSPPCLLSASPPITPTNVSSSGNLNNPYEEANTTRKYEDMGGRLPQQEDAFVAVLYRMLRVGWVHHVETLKVG